MSQSENQECPEPEANRSADDMFVFWLLMFVMVVMLWA